MRKSRLMDELLPRLQITLSDKTPLRPETLFDAAPQEIWLEIGFGGGEHLAAQAQAHSAIGFIGCEPFVNGVASLLGHLDSAQIDNVRIYPDDARALLDAVPDASLSRCFVLFSDPWPKARHAERRFINPPNIARLARALKPGAELRIATDHTILADHVREKMNGVREFVCESDSATPPEGWVRTRYEEKGIKAGRSPVYMIYRRA